MGYRPRSSASSSRESVTSATGEMRRRYSTEVLDVDTTDYLPRALDVLGVGPLGVRYGVEPYQLVVGQAVARGDLKESERLVSSCPRESCTMNERGFGARWSGAADITLRFYISLGEQLAKLQMVTAFREMVPYQQTLSSNIAFDAYFTGHKSGSYHAWNYTGQAGCPPAWPEGDDPEEVWESDGGERDPAMQRDEDELEATVERFCAFLPKVLDRLERTCVSEALTMWTGYAAFCEENMGVPAEKVAAVVLEPAMEKIRGMKARAERLGIEADAETVEEIREGLGEAWRMVETRGV
jgi:hypothetical protein